MINAASSAAASPPIQKEGVELYPALMVFGSGLAVRLWLIHAFPIIFGGDSIVRLANSDRVFLSYQLPLLQAAIHWLSMWSNDPLLVRYFMALAGATTGLAFYALACSLLGRTAGFQTALLFVSSPFIVAFSIVPYQEILMLAGLFAAFYFAFEQHWLWAGFCLGLACLTRYEAWLACPVIASAFLIEKGIRPLELARVVVLFGWAPLTWMAYHGGVTPEGTYAAEASFSLERFFRYVYLGWITVKNTPAPALLLAVLGGWIFWKQRLFADRRYQLLAAFLVLFLAAILLSAHGERDQPERFVTAREAHILLAGVVLVGGVGLYALPRFRWGVVLASCFTGLWMAHSFVENEISQPAFALSFEAARYLDQHVGSKESAVVLAQPVPRDLLTRHLDKAEQSGGPAGRERALANLLDLDTSPPNYQRILVHSRLGKDQLRSLASPPIDPSPSVDAPLRSWPEWTVLWSDFEATNEAEAMLQDVVAKRQPAQTLERGDLQVRIYHLPRN